MLDSTISVLYLIAGTLCAMVALRSHFIFSSRKGVHKFLWLGLACVIVLFGVNEVLDLQTPFTNTIKELAREQGWYALGQDAQVVFIYGLMIISFFTIAMVLWLLRNDWRQYWLLIFGLIMTTRFVIVRAASFYAVPLPELSRFTGGLHINWMLEPLGAVFIAIAAGLNLLQYWQSILRKQPRSHT